MAEVSQAPLNGTVRNIEIVNAVKATTKMPEQLQSFNPLPIPVTFPFEWRLGDIIIATILKLSESEQTAAQNVNEAAKLKPIVCAICGGAKSVSYRKESGTVSHVICEACATRYVHKARELSARH
jgi:uncharacterized protein (DUF2062 family)